MSSNNARSLSCCAWCAASTPGTWNSNPAGTTPNRGPMMTRIVAVILLASSLALADDAANAGRKVLSRYQDAVVTVKLVVSLSMSLGARDQQSESKTEAVGTVIDPSGLTVISLSTIDPSAMMKAR